MNVTDYENIAKSGWWNGVNVIVNDKNHLLKRTLTPEANKDLYFITHDIFRNKFAKVSYDIIKLVQNSNFEGVSNLISSLDNSQLYDHQNTYSNGLSEFNLI
jgi:hypothetical protein